MIALAVSSLALCSSCRSSSFRPLSCSIYEYNKSHGQVNSQSAQCRRYVPDLAEDFAEETVFGSEVMLLDSMSCHGS